MGSVYSEAQKKASIKYLEEKTDSIRIRVPKGTKEIWKAYADSQNISLTKLIARLMAEEMDKNNSADH